MNADNLNAKINIGDIVKKLLVELGSYDEREVMGVVDLSMTYQQPIWPKQKPGSVLAVFSDDIDELYILIQKCNDGTFETADDFLKQLNLPKTFHDLKLNYCIGDYKQLIYFSGSMKCGCISFAIAQLKTLLSTVY